MSRFYFLDDNCMYDYDKNGNSLTFRFDYTKRLGFAKKRYKYRIVSCTLNELPFITDKIVELRLNVVVYTSHWSRYEEEARNFVNISPKVWDNIFFERSGLVSACFNFKCEIDGQHINLILNPNLDKSLWKKSNSRKSMDIAYFSGKLPFSSYLRLYFFVFILRENLDFYDYANSDDFYDDEDILDIDEDAFNL